jgi:glycyl-tRNA synthetase
MVSWTKNTKKVYEVKFTPSVIKPSFGMGRVLHALLEHSFYTQDGDEYIIVM